MATYLQNGIIFDGLGSPPKTGGIFLDGDRILEFRDTAPPVENLEVIDCSGLWVMPGLIDAHSHNDFLALHCDSEHFFRPFLMQGITTFVTGSCGYSASGFAPDSPFANEIGGAIFPPNDQTDQHGNFAVWLAAVEQRACANIASLTGHGSARTGENGQGSTPLTAESLEQMLFQLEEALKAGALGVSLGLMYEPGIFASMEELLQVARLVKKYDRILTVHPKAESNVSMAYPLLGRSHLLRALDELAFIARETGVRFEYSHLIFVGRRTWPDVPAALKILEDLKSEGYDVGFDIYSLNYGASVITVLLPEWYMKLSTKKRLAPWTRFKLWAMTGITETMLGFGFPDITISYAGEDHRDWIGKTIPDLAKQWGCSNFHAYIRACDESHFQAAVLQDGYQNLDIMQKLMQHPLSLYMTDAWVTAHGKQNGAIYGTFPMFLEQARDIGFPIEQAVAKMTGLTAQRFQMKDRGELRPGAYADITIVDPATLQNRIAEELPPLGIPYVFVNGQAVVYNGEYRPGQNAGQVIRVNTNAAAAPAV